MDESFEDPRLKAAVRRCWAGETAPQELRARIQSLLASNNSDVAGPFPPPAQAAGKSFFGYAMAAGILLAAGLATWMVSGPAPAREELLPTDVASSMIMTHDGCCQAANHHGLRGIGADDFPAIAQRMESDLKVPVISRPIDHWQFMGAAPCPVWGHESAHLLYRDGARTMSVFSIPACDFSMTDKEGNYSVQRGTHELAGFIKGDGLYCVVANSPDGTITLHQTEMLRDKLRDSLSAPSHVAERRTNHSQDIAFAIDDSGN